MKVVHKVIYMLHLHVEKSRGCKKKNEVKVVRELRSGTVLLRGEERHLNSIEVKKLKNLFNVFVFFIHKNEFVSEDQIIIISYCTFSSYSWRLSNLIIFDILNC